MTIKENLFSGRILSIDAFRGITIFAMIFVNELAGVKNVPGWMKHALASEDKMTFVDLVFPAFLFIVGMSIPFALNARLKKGDSPGTIWKHTLQRTIALLVMGVFMVNTEYGFDESQMLIPMALWALLAYSLPIPIWNKYLPGFPKSIKFSLQYGAMILLVILYFLYIQDTGDRGMTPKWWGILGLIGWAYLITSLAYWFGRGKILVMYTFLVICVLVNIANVSTLSQNPGFSWINIIGGHFAHASLVVSGVILSLLFFDEKQKGLINWKIVGFTVILFIAGYFLRPAFGVSKIGATPSWCLYSAGFCIMIYYLMYWVIEVNKQENWMKVFKPAASNPLLIYIIPGIIIYFNKLVGIEVIPDFFGSGIPGITWSLVFSFIMLFVVFLFNKINIRLHL